MTKKKNPAMASQESANGRLKSRLANAFIPFFSIEYKYFVRAELSTLLRFTGNFSQ